MSSSRPRTLQSHAFNAAVPWLCELEFKQPFKNERIACCNCTTVAKEMGKGMAERVEGEGMKEEEMDKE